MKTVKTMIFGGLIFLVPFAVALLVFGKVCSVALRLAEPLDGMIPIEAVGGVALANILAVAIILLACFLAGIVATRTWGKRIYGKIDEWLLNLIPRYGFIKSMTESIGGQLDSTLVPVLVRFDDLSQIAFEVERGPGDPVWWCDLGRRPRRRMSGLAERTNERISCRRPPCLPRVVGPHLGAPGISDKIRPCTPNRGRGSSSMCC